MSLKAPGAGVKSLEHGFEFLLSINAEFQAGHFDIFDGYRWTIRNLIEHDFSENKSIFSKFQLTNNKNGHAQNRIFLTKTLVRVLLVERLCVGHSLGNLTSYFIRMYKRIQ